jgi:hypothetical protein
LDAACAEYSLFYGFLIIGAALPSPQIIHRRAYAQLRYASPFVVRLDNMKRCAQCRGKLGLGVRFRNLWNGRGWTHLRFCSSYCASLYDLARRESRWQNYLIDAAESQRNTR